MRCLVTGSQGFIAKNLIRELLKDKDVSTIIGASRYSDIVPYDVGHQIHEEVYCELTNPISVKNLIKQTHPDVVFHLASKARVKDSSPEVLETNLLSTHYLLENFHGRFVYVSSDTVYGPMMEFVKTRGGFMEDNYDFKCPCSVYALSKSASEDLVKL